MTDPDEYFPVNTIPALSWALDLYFKAGGKFKEGGVLELIFPAGTHKVMMQKKGDHDIILWILSLIRLRIDADLTENVSSTLVELMLQTERL